MKRELLLLSFKHWPICTYEYSGASCGLPLFLSGSFFSETLHFKHAIIFLSLSLPFKMHFETSFFQTKRHKQIKLWRSSFSLSCFTSIQNNYSNEKGLELCSVVMTPGAQNMHALWIVKQDFIHVLPYWQAWDSSQGQLEKTCRSLFESYLVNDWFTFAFKMRGMVL